MPLCQPALDPRSSPGFGRPAQVVDNQAGVVLDHNLEQGNPSDAPQLAPAVERVINRTGRKPRTATCRSWLRPEARRRRPARPPCQARRDPPQGQTGQGQAGRGTPTGVPQNREVAHRQRGPDQQSHTQTRLGSHPPGRH